MSLGFKRLRYLRPGRLRLKRDDTRAETRFLLSPKRTSPFKSVGASVQSTTDSRGVRISGSNAGYTTFLGSVRVLTTHSFVSFLLTSPPVRHRVPSSFKRTLLCCFCQMFISLSPNRE